MSDIGKAVQSTVAKGLGVVANLNRKLLPHGVAAHPYLSGIQKPMSKELTLADLRVTGVIPPALRGRYMRIGPNPIVPDAAGYNWFMGDGMIHSVELLAYRAPSYENRWIRSKAVTDALGEPPAAGPRSDGGDLVNTSIYVLGGRTFALVEGGPFPVEIGRSLYDQRHNDFDGSLHGSFTAHPIVDPTNGQTHAITYSALEHDKVTHVVLSREGQVIRELDLPVKGGPCVHSCGLTSRYVIVFDLNVRFSMKAFLSGYSFPYEWDRDHEARVGLLPRNGTSDDVIWCPVEPTFVFHCANAFDDPDGRVVMDVVAYDRLFADSHDGPDASGRLERWTIIPQDATLDRRVIDGTALEFPRMDDRRSTQTYRYVYSPAFAPDMRQFSGNSCLYKHDLESGRRTQHDFGPNHFPGEFVFEPAAADSEEDDGWLIGLVVDATADTTDLVILDARDVEQKPQAIVHLPHRVPPGFHGGWFSESR
jgi:8'-apo-carotenoid 13,14-cleaving dioxygenase